MDEKATENREEARRKEKERGEQRAGRGEGGGRGVDGRGESAVVLDGKYGFTIFGQRPETKYICIWLYLSLKRVLGCRPRMYLKYIWPEAEYICMYLAVFAGPSTVFPI